MNQRGFHFDKNVDIVAEKLPPDPTQVLNECLKGMASLREVTNQFGTLKRGTGGRELSYDFKY